MPKRKQSNPSGRSPLATKPLPQAEASPAPEAANSTQATLTRLLNGTAPADRRESFLWLRWGKLTRWQQYALAYEWGLPFKQFKDKLLAITAMRELG